jgi:hypothetical protein
MYLQVLETAALAAAALALALVIFLVSRTPRGRQSTAPREGEYTPGEREILEQLAELRERVERIIPPYGRVGYVPPSLEEIRDLLGFTYIKLGSEEVGDRPQGLERFEELNADFIQARTGDVYVYVVRRGEKKLVAAGRQYLDYLTARFLYEALDYI